jgi:hypothetical protein
VARRLDRDQTGLAVLPVYNNMMYSRQATEADVKADLMFPTLGTGAQGPQFLPPFSISRQGSIPHGNSIQLFGNQPARKLPKEDAGIPHKDIEAPPLRSMIRPSRASRGTPTPLPSTRR